MRNTNRSEAFKSYFKLLFCAAILTVALSSNIFAWGNEGHRITVRIAANYLTPAAQAEVLKLLRTDIGNNEPYYEKICPDVLALSKKTALTKTEETTLVSDGLACISAWADPPVKSQRLYTSNWHFVDIPVVSPTTPTPMLFTYDAARDCQMDDKRGDCIIQALARFAPVIADYKNPAAKDGHQYGEELTTRAEALKYFVHLVGDLHQPLHCVTDKKDKDAVNDPKDLGDLGGNNKNVSWLGDTDTSYGFMNLHSVWDGGIIRQTMQAKSWSESQYAQELLKTIDSASLPAIQKGDYRSWAAESYNLAVKNVYGALPKYDEACQMTHTNEKTKKVETKTGCYQLGKDYYEASKPIVEQQLKSGGLRLAVLLNSLLNVQQ